METPVVFQSEGQQVMGVLHSPDVGSSGSMPAVAFFHGFTGNKVEVRRMFVRVARALADKGVVALRFDFRGSGDSAGEFSEMRISGCIQDGLAAIKFLRKQPGVDPLRMGVIGFSMGGLVASEVLAREDKLRAAAFWSPVANPAPLVQELRQSPEWASMNRRGFMDLGGWSVSHAFFKEYEQTKPLESFAQKKLSTNILLIHGSDDDAVPVSHSYDYYETFKTAGAKVKLQILEGAGHTYEQLEMDRTVVSGTAKWMSAQLLRKIRQ